MSDVSLFRISARAAVEIAPQPAPIEKSLQQIFEANLETLLGVRFLATEYSTGPVHGGRIDTLGLDEDGSPVIIEYKRTLNENVINQGLFYLDWLMDHRREFQWLVMDVLGREVADTVEWGAPRLLCIAGDFTRYDNHAVKQIARNIELLRYRRFGSDLMMIELVHAPTTTSRTLTALRPGPVATEESEASVAAESRDSRRSDLISYRLQNASAETRDVWDAVIAIVQSLGDDVQVKELKLYYAAKRLKNFCCLEVYPNKRIVLAYLRLDPSSISLESGFTRDMRGIGHFGTGDLEVRMSSLEDVTRAQPLLQRAYEGG